MIAWVGAGAAFVLALGVLYTKVLRPVLRAGAVLDRYLPVLLDLGKQMDGNGTSLLSIRLAEIAVELAALKVKDGDLVHDFNNWKQRILNMEVPGKGDTWREGRDRI